MSKQVPGFILHILCRLLIFLRHILSKQVPALFHISYVLAFLGPDRGTSTRLLSCFLVVTMLSIKGKNSVISEAITMKLDMAIIDANIYLSSGQIFDICPGAKQYPE